MSDPLGPLPPSRPPLTPEQRKIRDLEDDVEKLKKEVNSLERDFASKLRRLADDTTTALRNLEQRTIAEFQRHGLR